MRGRDRASREGVRTGDAGGGRGRREHEQGRNRGEESEQSSEHGATVGSAFERILSTWALGRFDTFCSKNFVW
jgi:hypothetical protein